MSAVCIFCKKPFIIEENTFEHVLLNCLGGRLKTNRVDCSKCNNEFGRSIDNDMAEAVHQLRCIGGLKSGDNHLPAAIKKVKLKSGRVIDLNPMMMPVDNSVVYKREKLPNGNIDLKMGVNSFEELAKKLPSFAKGVGATSEELMAIIEKQGINVQREQIQEGIHFGVELGGLGTQRSMAKSLLVLWCFKFGNDDFSEIDKDEIIKFILDANFALNNKKFVKIDSRKIPLPEKIASKRDFSEHYNLMTVFSDEEGHLYGVFRLYNFVSWIFDFKKKSIHKKKSITLISNPFSVDQWAVLKEDEPLLDIEWVHKRSYVLKEAEEQTFNFMNTMQERNEKKAISDMVNEVISDCFPADGERIEKEHIDRIVSELSLRYVEKELGLNGVRRFSGDKAIAIIKDYMGKKK